MADPQAGPPSGGHRRGLQPHHALLPEASSGEEPVPTQLSVRAAEGRGHQPAQGGSAPLLEPGLGPGGGHAHSAPAAEREPQHHARCAAVRPPRSSRGRRFLVETCFPFGVFLQSRRCALRAPATSGGRAPSTST